MKLALAKLKRCVRDLDKRPLTSVDFYRLCRREKIKVIEIPLSVPGFYVVCKGKAYIYLNNRLRGIAWLLAAFHELGHHFLHAPPFATVALFYQLKPDTKQEKEAQAFAIIALIPEPLMRKLLASGEYTEDEGLSAELLKERCDLYVLLNPSDEVRS